jgi:hypothetical protein
VETRIGTLEFRDGIHERLEGMREEEVVVH